MPTDPPTIAYPRTVLLTCRVCGEQHERLVEAAYPAPCPTRDADGPCTGWLTEAMVEQAVQEWRDWQRNPENR